MGMVFCPSGIWAFHTIGRNRGIDGGASCRSEVPGGSAPSFLSSVFPWNVCNLLHKHWVFSRHMVVAYWAGKLSWKCRFCQWMGEPSPGPLLLRHSHWSGRICVNLHKAVLIPVKPYTDQSWSTGKIIAFLLSHLLLCWYGGGGADHNFFFIWWEHYDLAPIGVMKMALSFHRFMLTWGNPLGFFSVKPLAFRISYPQLPPK